MYIVTTDQDRLCTTALHAAARAYAPYSNFRVGAALLCDGGRVYTGVNVENRSFGLTICAERNAIAAAVAAGEATFVALAIAGLDAAYPLPPCGACRQVISEFLPRDAPVYFRGRDSETVVTTVGSLLPHDSLTELSRPTPAD